jgi:hypothetical protein
VRVTLRARLDGRVSVRFRNRLGRGNPRIDPVACPSPGQSVPVSVSVRVPSWARMPAQVAFALPTGTCGATASPARALAITPGKAGNHRDAWGRKESTLRFSFDLSDGSGTGTVTPSVTAGWS